MSTESYHVMRTRTMDTSFRAAVGGPDRTGEVKYSKTFHGRRRAQREADAWNGTGAYAKHGSTDWEAVVVPGRAPREDRKRASR